MFIHPRSIWMVLAGMIIGASQLSCKKMLTVPEPVNGITTTEVFNFDAQGASAMAGVYNQMINGSLSFSNGAVTILTGMSSDESFYYGTTTDLNITAFAPNQLLYNNSYTNTVWSSAYKTIYGANAVIEGVAASTAITLTDSARKELTGEAKFIRAFCYFYLTNLYGDVPLSLTVDFNVTRNITRTPVADVYKQIIQDLKDAQSLLPKDYSVASVATDRIMPNAWAATALLARAYLYTGDYANAAIQAGAVIGNTTLYNLESNLNNVFLVGSKEAIWQLKQGTADYNKNGTVEAFNVLPNPLLTGVAHYCMSAPLLNAFEPGDRRRKSWVDSTTSAPVAGTFSYFPFKYKTGGYNAVAATAPTEYYMVLRLAEMYLVRAEAAANGATGGAAAAVADLNVIRSRAGLPALSTSLSASQAVAAVAHERQVELFAEWGHRWLDLNRTGQAHAVLSAIAAKQPWTGDYQLLYPIPPTEIQVDRFLVQNPGY